MYSCEMSFLRGTKIGAYEIQSLIGEGGMGEVYRARDPRLGRDVALKALSEKFVSDQEALLRFEREAKTLASISHAHILTIHDIVIDQGRIFLITEFLEGETLKRWIEHHHPEWQESVKIAVAISDGLAAAHSKGIIHRDLKAENVFVTQDGQIKILDFGLARTQRIEATAESWMNTSPDLTTPGTVVGTLRCMPPEQLRGEQADARSDIFSLGCILYELLTGKVPFDGKTALEITAAILRDRPAPIKSAKIPKAFIDITFRCLEKDPANRFDSPQELSAALKSLSTEQNLSGKRRAISRSRSVAVFPITHTGGTPEDEYLMDGITETIINTLSQLPKLRVTARSTVFRYKGKDIDPLVIGRDLNVQTLMTGRGSRRGEKLEIQVELVNADDGSQIWGQHFSGNISDVFLVQQEIALQISAALQKKLTGKEKKLLAKRSTHNIDAYQSYLKGRYHWNKRTPEGFERAISYYQSAIESDPTYALAYTGIADSYNFLGWDAYGTMDPKETFPKAIAAATRALEIDSSLAEAHNSLGWAQWAYNHDWEGAEKSYLCAIELNPGYALAHVWYADLLLGSCRFDEALSEIQTAHNLDPLAPIVYGVHSLILYSISRYEESRQECWKALELQPEFTTGHFLLARAYLMEGNFEEAIRELGTRSADTAEHPRVTATRAYAYAVSGQVEAARRLLEEMIAIANRKYFPALIEIGLTFSALGDIDTAFEWLERAYHERASLLVWLYPEPMAARLRNDPRFDDLMQRIGAKKTTETQRHGAR